MEELIQVVESFGVTGLWAIVLYKFLDFAEVVGVFLLIGYGIKKAWPTIKKLMEDC